MTTNQYSNKYFSIVELLTVVLIVLLLFSLLVPIFVNLKMNARSALCGNNLRQIGTLITSYQADHNGYLPNDNEGILNGITIQDIPLPTIGNNNLYGGWNGHLLPYMDVNLPDKYTRYAMVTKVGTTRYSHSQLGGEANSAPPDVLKNAWIVVDDAWRKGGYQDLKMFICPEVQQNTIDIAAAIKFNNVRVPRILELVNGGVTSSSAFRDAKGYDYGMRGGIPSTYLANNTFFGEGPNNSLRMDQITSVAQKAFMLEGGLCDTFGDGSNGSIGGVYYSVVGGYNTDGGDVSGDNLNGLTPQFHKLNFVHDNYDTFWIMSSQNPVPFPNKNMSLEAKYELAVKFNNHFAGKAWMFAGSSTTSGARPMSYSIVSNIYPGLKGEYFKTFFDANPPGIELNPFQAFTDNPNEFHYLTGNMNVLFGDGSVAKKEQAWLCNNRKQFGTISME